ncbi:ferredoxin [Actinophytocola sediminis]
MKVFVDQERCVGSGQCVLAAADVFDQRAEDGVVTLHHDSPHPDRLGDVEYAAASCPSLAISFQA